MHGLTLITALMLLSLASSFASSEDRGEAAACRLSLPAGNYNVALERLNLEPREDPVYATDAGGTRRIAAIRTSIRCKPDSSVGGRMSSCQFLERCGPSVVFKLQNSVDPADPKAMAGFKDLLGTSMSTKDVLAAQGIQVCTRVVIDPSAIRAGDEYGGDWAFVPYMIPKKPDPGPDDWNETWTVEPRFPGYTVRVGEDGRVQVGVGLEDPDWLPSTTSVRQSIDDILGRIKAF